LASAQAFVVMCHQFRREARRIRELADVAIAYSTDQGFPAWATTVGILRGWALAEQGQKEEGIVQLRHGLAAWRAAGSEQARSHQLALLAEAYGKAGQSEEGLTLLVEALNIVDKTAQRYYQAELHRLKGELLLKCDIEKRAEAQACFREAIMIARQQQAKSLELRAATSLARLLRENCCRDEARTMLADIYGWFTEGFDTADLKEAKGLLDELSIYSKQSG
jgi:predicted ATPase